MGKSPASKAASANAKKLGVAKSKASSVGKKAMKKRLEIDLEQPKDRDPVNSNDVDIKQIADDQDALRTADEFEAQRIAERESRRREDYNKLVPKLSEWWSKKLYCGEAVNQAMQRMDRIQTGNALFAAWDDRYPGAWNQPCLRFDALFNDYAGTSTCNDRFLQIFTYLNSDNAQLAQYLISSFDLYTIEDTAAEDVCVFAITKLKVSQFCRLYKTAWRQEVFALATAQRVITTDEKSPRFWQFSLVFDPRLIVQRAKPSTWMWRTASEFFANPWTVPAINPHIVEEFERFKGEPTIAKAQSKFKKRLASTPANLKGAKAHDSPENLNPSNEPMEFVEIVWHALTTAFPTKQGWNQNEELLSYLHTTTILFYDVYAAHQKWPPTMGSNDNKSQEMALKSTRTAPEHAQESLEATTRSNSTTLLTVDLVKDNPYEHKLSMLYGKFVLFLSLEKIQQTDFLVLHFQIPTIRVGAPICPLTVMARKNCIQFFPWKRYPQNSFCIQGDIRAPCLYFPTNSGSANLSPDMID